jgi:hypothetical protein
MKKLILTLSGLILILSLSGQAPDYFHYQAVLRNPDGTFMTHTDVSMEVALIQGSVVGPAVYTEVHNVQTNERGMVILKIGDGTFFHEIAWENGPFFLSISVNGEHVGTSQLLSVPYALYARRAGTTYDEDSDPTNEIQILNLDDRTLEISGGNSIVLPDVNTPWRSNIYGIHYYHNVGIGSEATLPDYPLDIIKNISGSQEHVLIRMKNLDEGGKGAASVALEAYEDKIAKTFYRSEMIQTSAYYDQIPDFQGMSAILAEGNGIALASRSEWGSLRFYTTTVQDTMVERARFDPAGDFGIGTREPKAKVHVEEGDVLINNVNRGVILQSPNGKYWRITVGDNGELISAEVSID